MHNSSPAAEPSSAHLHTRRLGHTESMSRATEFFALGNEISKLAISGSDLRSLLRRSVQSRTPCGNHPAKVFSCRCPAARKQPNLSNELSDHSAEDGEIP